MTIAKRVRDTINSQCPGCFSLYAGYGLNSGQPVRYPQGHVLREKRNNDGRCVMAVYQYADDSQLTYRYKNDGGYSLEAV